MDKKGNEKALIDVLGTDSDAVLDEVENKISISKLYGLIDKMLKGKEKLIIQLKYGLTGAPQT